MLLISNVNENTAQLCLNMMDSNNKFQDFVFKNVLFFHERCSQKTAEVCKSNIKG